MSNDVKVVNLPWVWLVGIYGAVLFVDIVVSHIDTQVSAALQAKQVPVVCTLDSAGEATLAQGIADAIMSTSPAE